MHVFKIDKTLNFSEADESVRKVLSFTVLQSQMENYQTVDQWLTGAG